MQELCPGAPAVWCRRRLAAKLPSHTERHVYCGPGAAVMHAAAHKNIANTPNNPPQPVSVKTVTQNTGGYRDTSSAATDINGMSDLFTTTTLNAVAGMLAQNGGLASTSSTESGMNSAAWHSAAHSTRPWAPAAAGPDAAAAALQCSRDCPMLTRCNVAVQHQSAMPMAAEPSYGSKGLNSTWGHPVT